MAEKKKVTIVTKKKKTGASTSSGKNTSSGKKASAKASSAQAGKKAASKKKEKSGLLGLPSLPELPSLPDLMDFPAGLAENAREVWMAGIGALSTVEEMGAEFFKQLVQKGEGWEQESRKKLTAASKQAGAAVEGARAAAGSLSQKPLEWTSAIEAQVEHLVEDSIEGVLRRMNVPTHDEVQDLIQRVTALSGKVDALSARLKLDRAGRDEASASPAKASSKRASTSAAKSSASTDTPVFHVVPHDEGWAVEKEGASRATSVHATKAEAKKAGRERAKAGATGRLVLHRQDGTIQDSFSYGDE